MPWRCAALALVLAVGLGGAAEAAPKRCAKGVLVKVDGKRTCRPLAKAVPTPKPGDPRLSFLRSAIALRAELLARGPRKLDRKLGRSARRSARRGMAKVQRVLPRALALLDAGAGGAAAAARRAACDGAPQSTSSSTVGGTTVSISSGATSTMSISTEVGGFRILARVNLGSPCDRFEGPRCPTAAGVLPGTDKAQAQMSLLVLKGGDVVSSTNVTQVSNLTMKGQSADDALFEGLGIADRGSYALSTGPVNLAFNIERKATVAMRTGLWLPDGVEVRIVYAMEGGRFVGDAVAQDLRAQLQRDYDASFGQLVARQIGVYRQREHDELQVEGRCAKLTLTPASDSLRLAKGDTGQLTATVEAVEGGGTATAVGTLSNPGNATFAPTSATGDPAAFGYTVTNAGDGSVVSATIRATSKAGVARAAWRQPTAGGLPATFAGSVTGTATYDADELGQGNRLEASWSAPIVLTRDASSPFGALTPSYRLSTGVLSYAYNGRIGGCNVVGSGPIDLPSQPDLAQTPVLQLDEATRSYRLQIGMPLMEQVQGGRSVCDDPDDNGKSFSWAVATGIPYVVDAPHPSGPAGADWSLSGTRAGNGGPGTPEQSWSWTLAPAG